MPQAKAWRLDGTSHLAWRLALHGTVPRRSPHTGHWGEEGSWGSRVGGRQRKS